MMQENYKNNTYLIINSSYESVDIALYQDKQCIEIDTLHKHLASSLLIPTIDTFLKKTALSLSDICFIGVNKGPGPFTTIRTVISTANGISFASSMPLIGINGLEALFLEHNQEDSSSYTVALLNAFGKDLYFYTQDKELGCIHSETLFSQLKKTIVDTPLYFIGQGASLYKEQIEHAFGAQASIATHSTYSSTAKIASLAYNHWLDKKEICSHLSPLYLKELAY